MNMGSFLGLPHCRKEVIRVQPIFKKTSFGGSWFSTSWLHRGFISAALFSSYFPGLQVRRVSGANKVPCFWWPPVRSSKRDTKEPQRHRHRRLFSMPSFGLGINPMAKSSNVTGTFEFLTDDIQDSDLHHGMTQAKCYNSLLLLTEDEDITQD